MSDKTFSRILTAVTLLGILCAAALVIYTAVAYRHASIVTFIARELW